MTKITLYTGGGVSLSPVYADGRTESAYVRLIADDGMMLQNGNKTALVIDALASDADNWTEVEFVEPDEDATTEDYENALADLGVRV